MHSWSVHILILLPSKMSWLHFRNKTTYYLPLTSLLEVKNSQQRSMSEFTVFIKREAKAPWTTISCVILKCASGGHFNVPLGHRRGFVKVSEVMILMLVGHMTMKNVHYIRIAREGTATSYIRSIVFRMLPQKAESQLTRPKCWTDGVLTTLKRARYEALPCQVFLILVIVK